MHICAHAPPHTHTLCSVSMRLCVFVWIHVRGEWGSQARASVWKGQIWILDVQSSGPAHLISFIYLSMLIVVEKVVFPWSRSC